MRQHPPPPTPPMVSSSTPPPRGLCKVPPLWPVACGLGLVLGAQRKVKRNFIVFVEGAYTLFAVVLACGLDLWSKSRFRLGLQSL